MNKYVKYGAWGLGAVAATFVTVKVLKGLRNRENKDLTKMQSKGVSKTEYINTAAVAQEIAEALGTGGTVLNPWNWTEDEQTALEAVLKVPKPSIPQLMTDYNRITKRVLNADLQKYLSTSDWAKISYKFA